MASFVFLHPARRLKSDPAHWAQCGPDDGLLVGFFMFQKLISPLGLKDFATDATYQGIL